MSPQTSDGLAGLRCHRCGYNLRAHSRDGNCPECAESVAESIRLAGIPVRPAWRDSDPRWRRRMLAGVWVLVLVPLMDVLTTLRWASRVPVPNVLGFPGTVRTLDETFLCYRGVYPPLVFCIGVVLLFAKERGRRNGRLDWTRRWGVGCSYVVLLLSAAQVLIIVGLVLAGISAIFLSMPFKQQPGITRLLVNVSTVYLSYGAHPKPIASAVLVAFSSIVVLLACVPLFDALRSSGPKPVALLFVVPLTLFALWHVAQAGRYWLAYSTTGSSDFLNYGAYFWPELLASGIANSAGLSRSSGFFMELAKWCSILAIAVCLSVAQIAACWQHRKARPG